MAKRILSYTVIFEPCEEGGYMVSVPALPGCVTQGETLDEAREMAEEAIMGYLEALNKAGEPVPEDIDIEPKIEKMEINIEIS